MVMLGGCDLSPLVGPDVFDKWAADLRDKLKDLPFEQITARLNAASRAIELYDAHEYLATALVNFNAAMPKGSPKIAKL